MDSLTIARITIEILFALTMPIGLICLFTERVKNKKGVGPNYIRIGGAILIVPLFGILALEKVLEPAVLAALLGSMAGYLLGTGSDKDEK